MTGLLTGPGNPQSADGMGAPAPADPQTPSGAAAQFADTTASSIPDVAAEDRTRTPAATTTRHSPSGGASELGEEVETGSGGGLDSSPPTAPEHDPARQQGAGPTGGEADRLSVAELQHALRIARAARERRPIPPVDLPDAGSTTQWLAVLAAHSGAGASTVALGLADVCQQRSTRAVHLVEWAEPQRSGLVAATIDELGVDASGLWRHGQRDGVAVHRRTRPAIAPTHPTTATTPPITATGRSHWPSDGTTTAGTVAGASPVIILDLSGTATELDPTLVIATVVVLRATVPGVRAAETLLESLTRRAHPATTPRIVAAALGARRWNAAAAAALGPRLRELREQGQLITVPVDRRLAITGPTAAPLPTPVLAAARDLLAALDLDNTDYGSPQNRVTAPLTDTAHPAADSVGSEETGSALDLLASLTGGDAQCATAATR